MRRIAPRIAVAAGTILAAIALSRCEFDTTLIQYQPDSRSTAEETTSRVARVNSVYEGKPCSIVEGMTLTKGKPQILSSEISISLNDAILEDGKPVAFLTIFGQGQSVLDMENGPPGVYTLNWSSIANLKLGEGGSEQIIMGQKGELLISISVGSISVDGDSSSVILNASVCRNY